MATDPKGHSWTEHFKVDGDRLLGEFKRLVAEGNVRRISIKQGEHTVIEFPVTIGVAGALFAPWLVAVGAVAAVVTDSSIVVERVDKAEPGTTDEPPADLPVAPAG